MVSVQSFADDQGPATRLARELGAPFAQVDLHAFPDGESLPTVRAAGSTVVVYRSLDRPDSKLVPLLLAADAWRRAGARRLVLVAPYLCYLRQDTVFRPGQPLSRDVIGRLVAGAFDRVVTVDPHLHRTRDLGAQWGLPVTVLSGARALAETFEPDTSRLVVGPDEESGPWAAALGAALAAPHATFRKRRLGDRSVELAWDHGVALGDRSVVLVDDVASTGETLAAAARLAVSEGASRVDVAVTHALLDAPAVQRLKAAGVGRIVSTDSCPGPSAIAPLAPLLAPALANERQVSRRGAG